jgi:hypothetical protein
MEVGITLGIQRKVREKFEYNTSNVESMTGTLHSVDASTLWSASYESVPGSDVPPQGSVQVIFCSVGRYPEPYGAAVHGLVAATLDARTQSCVVGKGSGHSEGVILRRKHGFRPGASSHLSRLNLGP